MILTFADFLLGGLPSDLACCRQLIEACVLLYATSSYLYKTLV
jgi:hypothetical protein